jgi:hypothetical protein
LLFLSRQNCKKLTQESVQTGAIFGPHGNKFDAHALAGARIPHQGASVDLTAGDSKHDFNALSGSGRFWGFDKYTT